MTDQTDCSQWCHICGGAGDGSGNHWCSMKPLAETLEVAKWKCPWEPDPLAEKKREWLHEVKEYAAKHNGRFPPEPLMAVKGKCPTCKKTAPPGMVHYYSPDMRCNCEEVPSPKEKPMERQPADGHTCPICHVFVPLLTEHKCVCSGNDFNSNDFKFYRWQCHLCGDMVPVGKTHIHDYNKGTCEEGTSIRCHRCGIWYPSDIHHVCDVPPMLTRGWQCPVCGQVWAPFVVKCGKCQPTKEQKP